MPLVNYIVHVCNLRDLGVPDRHGVYKTHLVGIGNGTETLEHYFHLSSRHLSNAWYMANQLGLKGVAVSHVNGTSRLIRVMLLSSNSPCPLNVAKCMDLTLLLECKIYFCQL